LLFSEIQITGTLVNHWIIPVYGDNYLLTEVQRAAEIIKLIEIQR